MKMNISDIFSQPESMILQKILEILYSVWYYLLPTGVIGGILLTQRVSCKCINSVLQIHGNSCVRVDNYEITKPIIAVFSDSINLPIYFRNLDISFPDTDIRGIIKTKKNILTPKAWALERNSKIKARIQYEWFPEKNELYIIKPDKPQRHPKEIIVNYKVTNCSGYELQYLELSVNLPLDEIDPDHFNPKFLEIIDVEDNRKKMQKRATKTTLLNDSFIHTLEVSWEANIQIGKTKIFEIHYKLNNT